jgi:oligopeptide/dipeptide ABC transporter ATP-binding protein
MACALATNPQVLICDEPTTALDVTTEREVLALFKKLCNEKQLALILITHNLALVSQYCDRVVLMHAGHIVESGSVENFFSNPLHPYTQGLLKAIPDVDQPHDLIPLKGSVWGGARIDNLCRFSHRCQFVKDECLEKTPELKLAKDHSVRCILY